MKHHVQGRPIGKCKGCCLNLRRLCAAGGDPTHEWSRGRCKSFNQAELLEQFLNPPPASGAKASKLARRAMATQTSATPRYNGRWTPTLAARR